MVSRPSGLSIVQKRKDHMALSQQQLQNSVSRLNKSTKTMLDQILLCIHDPWLINLICKSGMSPRPALYEQNKHIINVVKNVLR
jgi:hypothetical protein